MICAAIPCGKVHKHWYSCGVPCGNLTIAIQNGPFGSLIYPLKMLIFYSFLYVDNRVNPLKPPFIEDDKSSLSSRLPNTFTKLQELCSTERWIRPELLSTAVGCPAFLPCHGARMGVPMEPHNLAVFKCIW
jgi:hypothetical protein